MKSFIALIVLIGSALVTAQSSCPTLVARSPKPDHLVCGANLAPSGRRATRNTLGAPSVTDLDSCAQACDDERTCISFNFDSSSLACTLYRASGKRMGLSAPASTTTQFYVRHLRWNLYIRYANNSHQNIACFIAPSCFRLVVSDTAGTYNGNELAISSYYTNAIVATAGTASRKSCSDLCTTIGEVGSTRLTTLLQCSTSLKTTISTAPIPPPTSQR